MERPGASVGTRIRLRPRLPASGSVRHRVTITSAMPALVHHIFWPVITHSSPSRTAVVRTAPKSLPQ
jgi:hypothetical protein